MTQASQNPYVGPRTFTRAESERFFGREREARDLLARVISERLVLFYAQSGAGKSSLINTRLIPQLQAAGFAMLPVGRVSGALPAGINTVDNIFVFNLLLSLDQNRGDPGRFSHLSLSHFLARLTSQDGEHYYYEAGPDVETLQPAHDELYEVAPSVLIIDQFEEIVTTHPEHWKQGADFFRQLDQAMAADPLLWVVLTLREDYIAALEPYAYLLADKLRARFYMRRLSYKDALEAIEQPAVQGGRPFASGVAKTLADNLCQIHVQGQDKPHLGEFIEPVQLQVVCYQLWENLKERPPGEITQQDLQELGNIDQALAQFYEQTIAKVLAQTSTSELDLRDWFERRLITEAGTRGTVYQGRERTGGLDNQTVELLANQFLVRAETRAGGTWYELVHDRFIEPILQANRDWRLGQSPLVQAAEIWENSGRSKDKLYQGQLLKDALANPNRQEPLVQTFLEESEKAQSQHDLVEERQRAKELTRNATRLRRLATALAVVFLLALGATAYAWIQRQQANEKTTEAVVARATAEAAHAEADAAKLAAQEQTFSRLLATQALNNKTDYSLALLLSSAANQVTQTVEAKSALFEILEYNPNPIIFLYGHDDRIWSVVYSPDGKIVASSGLDGRILMWDVATRRLLGELPTTGSAAVYSVAFSPDGEMLASGDGQGVIMLWDVAARQPLGRPLLGHHEAVYSVVFSPDGQTLASSSMDKSIILWDVASGQPLGQSLTGHTDWVWKVAFSPDGQTLASVGRDERVILWDVATRQPLGPPLLGHRNTVASLAFSPNGRTLASGDGSGVIILWDVASHLKLGQPLTEHVNTVWSLAFKPDGRVLASSSQDGKIILWDTLTHQPLQQLAGQGDYAYSLAFSPDGQTLASGGTDSTVILWNITTRQRLVRSLTRQPSEVYSVAFSPAQPTGQQILAVGRKDGLITLWDVVNHQPISPTLSGHTKTVNMVAFSPDGQTLASASADNTIRLWDITSHQSRATLSGHKDTVTSLDFSPDGQILASASADQTITLWNAITYQPLSPPLRGHSVRFSPAGDVLASAGQDAQIRLWNVATRRQLGQPLAGHTSWIDTLAFNPNGQTLASGSYDSTIILWNITTHERIGWPLTDHTSFIYSLTFSPDGQVLASTGNDKTIILWDTTTYQRLGQPLSGSSERIRSIAFNPTGQILASGGADKSVLLWDVSFASWQARACSIANRNLTKEEWERYFGDKPYQKTCPKLPLHPSLLEAGRELAEAGNIAGAVDQIKHGLASDPGLDNEPEAAVRQLAAQSFVKKGKVLAGQGNIADAVSQFQEALKLNPNLDFNPEQEARRLAAIALVRKGWLAAQQGEVANAIPQFQEAMALNPNLSLEPAEEARRLAAQALLEDGRKLAKEGKLTEAIEQFQKALDSNLDLNLEPEAEVQRLAAQASLEQGQALAREGQLEQALGAYTAAQEQDPTLEISATAWDTLCRAGSRTQTDAFKVRKACEQAVALAPKAAWAHDSRGVVRALSEAYSGASEDFRFVVKLLRENDLYQGDSRREEWIGQLIAGQNPFPAATRGTSR